MKLYKYTNYEEYVNLQTLGNKAKLHLSWVKKSVIESISLWHNNTGAAAENILCHGTRSGIEQQLFLEFFPKAYVIGTEISETASQFPNTKQHDFHEEIPEWVDKFDIIYSNSWDHSYDPHKSIKTWKNQLNDTGHLYLEYAFGILDNRSSAIDPLEISEKEMLPIFEDTGLVHDGTILANDSGPASNSEGKVFVLKKQL